MSRCRGFTLLEVLVALAVLAITLGALIKGGSEVATNGAYLRDKTLAQWVARNRVAELQLETQWPETGSREGREEMAGREWFWRSAVSETFDEDVRRLEVGVYADERREELLDRVVAFLPRPEGAAP